MQGTQTVNDFHCVSLKTGAYVLISLIIKKTPRIIFFAIYIVSFPIGEKSYININYSKLIQKRGVCSFQSLDEIVNMLFIDVVVLLFY